MKSLIITHTEEQDYCGGLHPAVRIEFKDKGKLTYKNSNGGWKHWELKPFSVTIDVHCHLDFDYSEHNELSYLHNLHSLSKEENHIANYLLELYCTMIGIFHFDTFDIHSNLISEFEGII